MSYRFRDDFVLDVGVEEVENLMVVVIFEDSFI